MRLFRVFCTARQRERAPRARARFSGPCMVAALLALQAPRDLFAAEERLRWDAPLGCPGVEAVRTAISAVAGRRSIEYGPLRSVRGRVERSGAEWQLTLEIVQASHRHSRIFTAPRCEDLVQAAGVAIALAFDTSAHEAGEAEATAEAGEAPEVKEPAASDSETDLDLTTPPLAPTPSAAVTSDVPSSPPPAEAQSAALLQLGMNAVLDGAALRSAALGVELSFGWRPGPLQLTAYGAWLPPQRHAQRGNGSAEFSLLCGGVRAGYELVESALGLAGYVSLELGRSSARGVDLIDARAFHDLWLAPGAGVELEKRLGAGWSIAARAGAIVPLVRQGYAVNADERIHRPGALGVRAGAGAGFAW